MKHVLCCGCVAAALALAAAAGAQDRKMDDKMGTMDAPKSATSYTGCLERSPQGAFTLTHSMASDAAMHKTMGHDSMAKDSMASDSMAKEPMAKDSMAHDSMMKDEMAPALALSSTSVDLSKHVGHKVTVKGTAGDTMGGTTAFTVKSLKMVGASCS